jgi:signal transduction histidine kinase
MVVGAGFAILCSAVFSYYYGHKIRSDGAGIAVQRLAESAAEQIDVTVNAALAILSDLADSAEIKQSLDENNSKYAALSELEISDHAVKELALWKASKQPQSQLQAVHKNQAATALDKFAARYPGFQSAQLVDRAGLVIAAFGELKTPVAIQEQWWQQAGGFKNAASILYQPVVTEDPASVIVPLAVAIDFQKSGRGGIIYAEYNLDRLVFKKNAEEIQGMLLGDNEQRDLIVFDLDERARPAMTHIKDGISQLQLGQTGKASVRAERLGITMIAGFAPIGSSLSPSTYAGNQWSVVTAIPEATVMRPLNSLFFRALIFSTLVLVMLSLVGLGLARRTLRPIRVLQQGVQEIGQGNLEHRIDIRSGDEIEVLAVEFNRMAERMQRAQEQLQKHSKELEQKVNQLRRLQAQLMQSERMAATGELAAQIAHEINNPLGIIKNYVGIAKLLMPEEDPNRENMKIVDQEINRIAGIVRRLLKFAKPGAEDIQPVRINQVLEELLALLRGQLFRRKIEVSAELAENLPEVNVSTDQIRQVFLNLIKNAEDAMPDGGKLTVRTRYRKGKVEIDVADDGCGIPPENIKNIFEPFFTTKGVKGTGLGLSVSYGIIKNYNGEISVDSEPGRGTTFTIQLPVVSDKVFQVIQSS